MHIMAIFILIFSIDLILNVRNPFYPKDRRLMSIYLPISLVAFLVGCFNGVKVY